jgi:exportin-5
MTTNMNGISHAPNGKLTNGSNSVQDSNIEVGQFDAQIIHALQIIHDPRSSNEHRQEASQYLEEVKSHDQAPYHGYVLAADKCRPPIVRHYGLSLLESVIRRRWGEYSSEQSLAVRDWTVKLARGVEREDPHFVRNKIGQLWVEIAKRSWGVDWMDMDEQLVGLWAGPVAQKELVLEVLETLSENSFGKEDTVTVLRGTDLSKACVEIFTPAQIMVEHFPKRDTAVNLRYGQEGWLTRIADLLGWCNGEGQNSLGVEACAVKTLVVLRSVVSWTMLPALAATHCVQRICESLTSPYQTMQLVRTRLWVLSWCAF